MATEAEKDASPGLDRLMWLVVLALLGGAVYGNHYFGAEPVLYRALGVVAIGLVAAGIALQTTMGRAFRVLVRESRIEVRKVVWPTRPETTQTTLVVLGVVLLTSVLLWGVDSLLSWLISLVIG